MQEIPPRRAALYLVNDLVTDVEFDQCWSAGILRRRNHFKLTISLSHMEIKGSFCIFNFCEEVATRELTEKYRSNPVNVI